DIQQTRTGRGQRAYGTMRPPHTGACRLQAAAAERRPAHPNRSASLLRRARRPCASAARHVHGRTVGQASDLYAPGLLLRARRARERTRELTRRMARPTCGSLFNVAAIRLETYVQSMAS